MLTNGRCCPAAWTSTVVQWAPTCIQNIYLEQQIAKTAVLVTLQTNQIKVLARSAPLDITNPVPLALLAFSAQAATNKVLRLKPVATSALLDISKYQERRRARAAHLVILNVMPAITIAPSARVDGSNRR